MLKVHCWEYGEALMGTNVVGLAPEMDAPEGYRDFQEAVEFE